MVNEWSPLGWLSVAIPVPDARAASEPPANLHRNLGDGDV
jgi:hypothetical protein